MTVTEHNLLVALERVIELLKQRNHYGLIRNPLWHPSCESCEAVRVAEEAIKLYGS